MAETQEHKVILDSNILPELKEIAHKVFSAKRISFEDGVTLYKHGSLGFVGTLADHVRKQKNGDHVFFNHNFHVEPTNVCVYSCSFCSYSRLIKNREQGWELSVDQILDIIKKYDDQAVTEVHITGGVVPKQDLAFYSELFKRIKQHRPSLHIKALTPVEFHYIFKKAKLTYEVGLKVFKDAGLDSLPGCCAEIFNKDIIYQIAGGKCTNA